MKETHLLTEWQLKTKSSDISIHLYWMPQKYQEKDLVEKEIGNLKYSVSRLNGFIIVESAAHLLGSFEEIKAWGDVIPLRHEYRCIDLTSSTERRLLERLLSRSLERAQDAEKFNARRRTIVPKNDRQVVDDFEVRRTLEFDITVSSKGRISVGFDLSHEFTHRKNVYQLIKEQSDLIGPNCKVKDIVYGRTYFFKEVLDKPISYPHLSSGENLIDYYKNKGKGNYVKSLRFETPAVSCVSKEGAEPLPFIPQLLKIVCSWDKVPFDAKKKTKMSTNQRMDALMNMIKDALGAWKQNAAYLPIEYDKRGLLANETGYLIKPLKKPNLQFGKGVKGISAFASLLSGGVVSPPSQPIECQFLVDAQIVKEFIKDFNGELDFPLFRRLSYLSNQLGVPMVRPDFRSKQIVLIRFDDPVRLRMELRNIKEHMNPEHPILIVGKKENLKKKTGPDQGDYYTLLKRELGREHKFSTQVVTFETSEYKSKKRDEKKKREDLERVYMNILLGIYVKMGIHPWKLSDRLHSDCFIGLDVCHEKDLHITGVIQVIGQDGLPLWTKPLSNPERGEVIRRETIEDTIYKTLDKFKQMNGRIPQHITFHRDGHGHKDELKVIRELLEPLQIKFDYVSIEKTLNRRMAYKIQGKPEWLNPVGFAYVKDGERLAYLCTTNPSEFVGMAQPFRMIQWTDSLKFDLIIEDVYRLTFMNIHSINKSRLPSTINYADKSASFFARGMLPLDTEMPIQSV
ncbi:Piwi domain-containing protein [Thermoactinomyces sp. CICC 10521]|uniref:Piwi domain-containing protein n=1 Tax=Thermoactinomyces sp. CICC 10521 TaxID=2767426 RepID=UPI0018DD6303|nr:Piwi domain-containing protein [Thermoactinomyces sp. CICC 10521]MBH8609119.1 hypothetical protein [Thermoactinomyces sp. CICC 10521]